MKIEGLQNAVVGCCAPIANSATSSTAWLGRNIQTLGSSALTTVKTAGKVTEFVLTQLVKFGQFTQAGSLAALETLKKTTC